MILNQIKKDFDAHISKKFAHLGDIKNFLLKHERKPMVVENLCEQIFKLEKYNLNANVLKYRSMVESVADMFASTALQHVEHQQKTHAKLRQEQQERDNVENAKDIMAELEKEATTEVITSYQKIPSK